jgi:hypothetical protein
VRVLAGIFTLATVLGIGLRADAKVFHSRESALELAFPEADRVAPWDLFLSENDVAELEAAARVKVASRLVTCYRGYRGEELLGYAFFDTHNVRTLPETFLLVLEPNGAVKATHILAFHEPLQYLPPKPWLEQFDGRVLDDDLWLKRGVAAIAGSTLSAQVLTAGVRRLLAVSRIKIAREARESPAPVETK